MEWVIAFIETKWLLWSFGIFKNPLVCFCASCARVRMTTAWNGRFAAPSSSSACTVSRIASLSSKPCARRTRTRKAKSTHAGQRRSTTDEGGGERESCPGRNRPRPGQSSTTSCASGTSFPGRNPPDMGATRLSHRPVSWSVLVFAPTRRWHYWCVAIPWRTMTTVCSNCACILVLLIQS